MNSNHETPHSADPMPGLLKPVSSTLRTLQDGGARILALPASVQFIIWFLLVLLIKHASLLEPPVWDSAMGVFPPAIYLCENGFDIRGLLQEPNWVLGGPNVHSLSLFTWIAAVVLAVMPTPESAFLVLHLLIFAAFAGTLLLFTWVLKSHGLEPLTVLVAAVLLLCMPIVLVQVGALYTESLVMGAGVAAWAAWRASRPGLAVLACVVAFSLKMTGVAIAAVIFGMLVLSVWPPRKGRLILLALLPLALFVQFSLPGWLGAAPQPHPEWGDGEELTRKFLARLDNIPDVKFLLEFAIASALLYPLVRMVRERNLTFLTRDDADSRARLVCVAMPLVFFAGVFVMLHGQTLFLARYMLPVFPFAIGSILLFAAAAGTERLAALVIAGLAVHAGLNFHGQLYHPQYASFSVVERSHAYRTFLKLQVKAIETLEEKPTDTPAYIGKEIAYMISHPMMGYVEQEIPNTHSIITPPHDPGELDAFPDHFLLLWSNSAHGGSAIMRIVRQALASPAHEVVKRPLDHEGFEARLYEVRKRPPPGDADPH